MTPYLPIIYFVAGLIVGIVTVIVGFRLGFRASYEIRNHREAPVESTGLFQKEGDADELGLVAEQDKEDTD